MSETAAAPDAAPASQLAGNVANPATVNPTTEPEREVERVATLTAEDPTAQINVRSQPSQTSDPLGYGRVGEPVILGRTDVDDEGYTWYYVTFQSDATVGWVREDLLAISALAPSEDAPASTVAVSQTPSDTLRRSLDETCGGQAAVEAFFTTPSNTIYICKVRNQRTYLSQEAGTEQVVTTQEVEARGGGYIVTNGNYEYRLDSGNLIVVRFDDSGQQEEVLRETVVYAKRY
ncbi:MAG: SH3 domain-containing protein [Leptolyngbya sp. SIOISBB]|nr:SH3 domain-containing protein [Leptolyngbya sp. SIOISBB]